MAEALLLVQAGPMYLATNLYSVVSSVASSTSDSFNISSTNLSTMNAPLGVRYSNHCFMCYTYFLIIEECTVEQIVHHREQTASTQWLTVLVGCQSTPLEVCFCHWAWVLVSAHA